MELIGRHSDRDVFYLDLNSDSVSTITKLDNWICFAIASYYKNQTASRPYIREKVNEFIRSALLNGMIEFKAQGTYGDELHDLCDWTMVDIEVNEGHHDFDIVTTGNSKTNLANAFWECFFATALPERADYERLKVICISFDGIDYRSELKNLLDKFEEGWLPED